jgi:hypothetical protein
MPCRFVEVNQHFRRKHFIPSLGSISNLARNQQKQATGHLILFVYCLALNSRMDGICFSELSGFV